MRSGDHWGRELYTYGYIHDIFSDQFIPVELPQGLQQLSNITRTSVDSEYQHLKTYREHARKLVSTRSRRTILLLLKAYLDLLSFGKVKRNPKGSPTVSSPMLLPLSLHIAFLSEVKRGGTFVASRTLSEAEFLYSPLNWISVNNTSSSSRT